jgi:hypothetical protein
MLTRLLFASILGLLLAAMPAEAGAPSDQSQSPAAAPAPSAQSQVKPHPRIWLDQAGLQRLRAAAGRQSYYWRRLIAWAEEPERGKARPQDGPGMALAAAVLAKEQPEQAERLAKISVACALKGAPTALSQGAGKRTLHYTKATSSEAELWEAGFHLMTTKSAEGRVWLIDRLDDNRLWIKPGQAAIGKLADTGEKVFFLAKDLATANQAVGWVALTLDWAWDFFEPKQRKDIAAWLLAQARMFEKAGRGCFSLDAMAALRLTGLAALAALGQNPDADTLLKQALEQRFRREILPCLINLGQGGGWFGGESAGARAGLDLLEFAAAVKSALGQELTQQGPWFKDRLGLLSASLLPGAKYTSQGGFNRLASFGDQIFSEEEAADLARLQMLILLALRPNDQAAGLARALLAGRRGMGLLTPHRYALELLWQSRVEAAEALAFAPLTYLAPSVGLAISRSDWSPLATWLAFSCGPHYALPQHLGAGAILLWRQGFLLPQAGGYDGPYTPHALNYAVRSAAQNTVLIHDSKEYSWLDMRQGVKPKNTYANDGGQRSWTLFGQTGQALTSAPWTASGWDQGPAPWSKLRDTYQVAGITASQSMPRYFYVRGDMTKAYQGNTAKATRVVRHVFHLRAGGPQDYQAPEAIVVIDDVAVARKELQPRFALHFAKRPEMPDDLKSLGPGRWKGPLTRLQYQNGRSKLEVRCLWPRETHAWVFGDEAAGSWVNGKNYPPHAPITNPAPWRVEIGGHYEQGLSKPMMHVLFPADAKSPPAPETTPLVSGQENLKGLVVRDPRWPRVVVVRLGEPDPLAQVSYKIPPGPTRHLVAGLLPEVFYSVSIKNDAVRISPGPGLKTGPAGLLSFVVQPGRKAMRNESP